MNVSSTNISWFEVANFGDLFIYINSYKIYLNGLIEQSGYVSTPPSSATYTISGLLFTSTSYTILFHTEGSDRSARDFRLMNVSDRNSNSYKFTMYAGGASSAEFSWYAFGY